jgi:hypothetical protein
MLTWPPRRRMLRSGDAHITQRKRACGTKSAVLRFWIRPRRGTPSHHSHRRRNAAPLTPRMRRRLAVAILHGWDAKHATKPQGRSRGDSSRQRSGVPTVLRWLANDSKVGPSPTSPPGLIRDAPWECVLELCRPRSEKDLLFTNEVGPSLVARACSGDCESTPGGRTARRSIGDRLFETSEDSYARVPVSATA